MKNCNRTHRRVDTTALEQKVKAMYRDVALDPQGEFHFEMDVRSGAPRLCARRPQMPSERAIDSFDGRGYYFDLARLKPARRWSISAAGGGRTAHRRRKSQDWHWIGVDMTDEQLAKAERLRAAAGLGNVYLPQGYRRDRTC